MTGGCVSFRSFAENPLQSLNAFGDRERRIANSKEGAVDDGRMRQLPQFSRKPPSIA